LLHDGAIRGNVFLEFGAVPRDRRVLIRWLVRGRGRLMRGPRLHVAYYGLRALSYVDMLDPHILIAAVTKPPKGLDLNRIGSQQSSRGVCKGHYPTLGSATAPEPSQDRRRRHVSAGHLDCQGCFHLVSGGSSLDHRE
jgi:hypothetical protein